MLYIKDLKSEDVGKWVLYKPSYGDIEKGKIKSWNEKFIFVVYKCDEQWERFQDFTGCATDPNDLNFAMLDEVFRHSNLKEAIKLQEEYESQQKVS